MLVELSGDENFLQDKLRSSWSREEKLDADPVRFELADTGRAELADTGKAELADTSWPAVDPGSPGPPPVRLWTKPTLHRYRWQNPFGGDEMTLSAAATCRRHCADLSAAWTESGENAYGCIKQLFVLKKSNRGLKTLLSIGGWTFSANFAAVASTDAGRSTFATSSVVLMRDWGFDGIDIDWEYPKDAEEAESLALLLAAVRAKLDEYASQHAPGYRFLLTMAAPAGKAHYEKLDLKRLSGLVDTFYLMGYDYAGPFASHAAHQANLYTNAAKSTTTPFSTNAAIAAYLEAGVPASQIVLGMPLFGRAFQNTAGLGEPFCGVGRGSWDDGTMDDSGAWDYKALPQPGAAVMYDETAVASFSYDAEARALISYDTPRTVKRKVAYITEKGLGGSMFWEASGDRTDGDSLITTSFEALGACCLGEGQNYLEYPISRYGNIRRKLE
ncbi:chitinase [Plectosphaerella cucumerina]|uniref:chitinase n=1 Tax=Plectosphaerella cucumerina TaxID=40658 RepID=A0A8K0TJA7_9PEZI|nr:chitinase [Plectosphaerella cucumerina]